MKFLIVIIFVASLSGSALARKASKKTVSPAAKVEKFTELKLQGNLKRPELAYDFADESNTDSPNLEQPKNFDSQLINDLEN